MTIKQLIDLMTPLTLDHEVYIIQPYDAFEDCLVFIDPKTHKQHYIEFDRSNPTLKDVPIGHEIKEST
jgi:hypothetical protein